MLLVALQPISNLTTVAEKQKVLPFNFFLIPFYLECAEVQQRQGELEVCEQTNHHATQKVT